MKPEKDVFILFNTNNININLYMGRLIITQHTEPACFNMSCFFNHYAL